MARFDVYEYKHGAFSLVLDVQADLLSDLATCVVVPLISKETLPMENFSRLQPPIEIDGDSYILETPGIGAIPRASLGEFVMNIEGAYREDVVEALDFLFQGF